jgi:hypothetical protein
MPEEVRFTLWIGATSIFRSEALRLHTQLGVLCCTHQIDCSYSETLLASSGQEYRRALGPDRHPHILRIWTAKRNSAVEDS